MGIVPSLPFGVYVHFPWCRRRCPYCDFAVEVAIEPPHQAYLEAVLGELAEQAPSFGGRQLVSIYFGGGTPSLWSVDCVAAVIRAVRERWAASGPLEITMEANPTDCQPERVAAWRSAGVNRVSVGVQSTRAEELAVLGRDHRMGDGVAAIARLQAAGELRVSADFIVGVPRRGPRGGRALPMLAPAELAVGDGAAAADLGWVDVLARSLAQHASVYELTVEDGAAFSKRVADGRLIPPPADDLAELYVAVHHALAARGFEHYEISSFARPGFRAVHNSLYWSGGEFLGLGVGAASYRRTEGGAVRWSNRRRFALYQRERLAERRDISPLEDAGDRLWLGLRTSDGVRALDLAERPGVTEWLLGDGLAELVDGNVVPTVRGFLFADAIAARIVGAAGGG